MSPRIRILSLLAGAREATGATVIIDVFRGLSLVPWALARGAVAVLPVRTEAEALALRDRYPGSLVAGGRDGRPVPGFDFSNSPAAIRRTDLTGRILIHRTGAGTQGLIAAMEAGAAPVLACSFLNVTATAKRLLEVGAREISLVAMGWNGREEALEDTLCAEYLRELLEGSRPDFAPLQERIREDATGRRFFDPSLPWFPEEDFQACMEVDRFDFAVISRSDDEYGVRLEPCAR